MYSKKKHLVIKMTRCFFTRERVTLNYSKAFTIEFGLFTDIRLPDLIDFIFRILSFLRKR